MASIRDSTSVSTRHHALGVFRLRIISDLSGDLAKICNFGTSRDV